MLELTVSGLSGFLCTIAADPSWSLDELKAAIEEDTGIPCIEQRLLQGTQEIGEAEAIGAILDAGDAKAGVASIVEEARAAGAKKLDLSLVRRMPEQAEWLAVVATDWKKIRGAPKWAKADREIVLAAVRQNGYTLQFASEELRADRGVVMSAVRQNGRALWFAADPLRNDREVVLLAVRQNACAFRFAGDDLRNDRQIILECVERDVYGTLQFLERGHWADAEIVRAAVQQHGQALQHASAELRADRAVVLAAVQRNGHALEFAALTLRADVGVVLAAVQCDGLALQFASEALRADVEVVTTAARQDDRAAEFASQGVLVDRAFMQMMAAAGGAADGAATQPAVAQQAGAQGSPSPTSCPLCDQISRGTASSTGGRPGHTYGQGCRRAFSAARVLGTPEARGEERRRVDLAVHWRLEGTGMLAHRWASSIRFAAPAPCASCVLGRHLWCRGCGPDAVPEARQAMQRIRDEDPRRSRLEEQKVRRFLGAGLAWTESDLRVCAFKGMDSDLGTSACRNA